MESDTEHVTSVRPAPSIAGYDPQRFRALVEEVGRFHGHVCGGIAIGTRMAMAALDRLGIADPRGADRKQLLVYVECDRCATDAIMIVTGCTPGKRSMKVLDHGKMAATFVHLGTGRAVRLAPASHEQQEVDHATVPAEALFTVTEVEVPTAPEDLPGKPTRRAVCGRCGEKVMDGREVVREGATLCRPCAQGGSYYRPLAAPKSGR